MRLMDEKGRVFGKLNIFDLLVILLLLAGLIGMATRLINPGADDGIKRNATYQLEISGVQQYAVDAYQVGDALYEKDVLLGHVTAVEVSPYQTTNQQPDGSYQLVDHLLYYTIRLTVATDQLSDKAGYHIGKQELLNGTTHQVSNGFISCEATVRELIVEAQS